MTLPSTSDAPVITVERVVKRFGDVIAVREVDIAIGRGEFFSLLGPSGCGKTTTLRMIAGFEEPDEGRILLDGEDVSHVPPYRRAVNTVFQQYALFPHMTVYDNVAFGPRSQKVDAVETDRRVRELLDIVRLGDLAQRKPAQLSGGQQQRVALARALVNYPKALLLDEPLGALDLKLRQAMQVELKRIQREVGIAFVYVTHDQEEALTMSDRIAVMNLGRVEQLGTPEEIYHAPKTVFVAGFIGSANLITVRVSGGAVLVDGARVAVASSAAENETATLMVRPERVRVSAEPRDGSVAATVESMAFQGPVVRLGLRTAAGTEIVAHVSQQGGSFAVGDPVHASWDPDAARILPES